MDKYKDTAGCLVELSSEDPLILIAPCPIVTILPPRLDIHSFLETRLHDNTLTRQSS